MRALCVDITSGPHRAGRLDHHPATGQDHLPHARKDDVAQARGDGGGARAGTNRLTKDQILELYLNRIYLGSGAYGVDGAARVYFGKSAKRVTLAEAAMLASLTRAPSVFSPRRDLAAAQARASRVLEAMVEIGAITAEQAKDARAHPATVFDQTRNVARNYFFDTAADEAQHLVPTATGDLIIVTTMDPGDGRRRARRHCQACWTVRASVRTPARRRSSPWRPTARCAR